MCRFLSSLTTSLFSKMLKAEKLEERRHTFAVRRSTGNTARWAAIWAKNAAFLFPSIEISPFAIFFECPNMALASHAVTGLAIGSAFAISLTSTLASARSSCIEAADSLIFLSGACHFPASCATCFTLPMTVPIAMTAGLSA